MSKPYPAAEPEIANMLGLRKEDAENDRSSAPAKPAVTGPAPAGLPVDNLPVEVLPAHEQAALELSEDIKRDIEVAKGSKSKLLETEEVPSVKFPRWRRVIGGILPYIIVFAIGIVLYYLFFSKSSFDITKIFNFQGKATQTQAQATNKEQALNQLKTSRSADYIAYMGQFFYTTTDAQITNPDTDYSHNGLTNFQKYLLQLNPKVYDTLGRGMPDGATVLQGVNPMTGLALTDTQKKIVDQYIDLEAVNNRLAQSTLEASQQATSTNQTAATSDNNGQVLGSTTPTATPTSSEQQPVLNTKPNQAEGKVDVDTGKPGLIEIPSVHVTVPLQWPASSKEFDDGLCKGVIRYPGTAMPGDIGTMYVSGHSSNYPWVKCKYNYVFSHLGDIKDGDAVIVTVTRKDGKTVKLHYVVKRRGTFKPTDQMQFANTSESLLAISTCWPVGETTNRLVLFAPLSQIEYPN